MVLSKFSWTSSEWKAANLKISSKWGRLLRRQPCDKHQELPECSVSTLPQIQKGPGMQSPCPGTRSWQGGEQRRCFLWTPGAGETPSLVSILVNYSMHFTMCEFDNSGLWMLITDTAQYYHKNRLNRTVSDIGSRVQFSAIQVVKSTFSFESAVLIMCS